MFLCFSLVLMFGQDVNCEARWWRGHDLNSSNYHVSGPSGQSFSTNLEVILEPQVGELRSAAEAAAATSWSLLSVCTTQEKRGGVMNRLTEAVKNPSAENSSKADSNVWFIPHNSYKNISIICFKVLKEKKMSGYKLFSCFVQQKHKNKHWDHSVICGGAKQTKPRGTFLLRDWHRK